MSFQSFREYFCCSSSSQSLCRCSRPNLYMKLNICSPGIFRAEEQVHVPRDGFPSGERNLRWVARRCAFSFFRSPRRMMVLSEIRRIPGSLISIFPLRPFFDQLSIDIFHPGWTYVKGGGDTSPFHFSDLFPPKIYTFGKTQFQVLKCEEGIWKCADC